MKSDKTVLVLYLIAALLAFVALLIPLARDGELQLTYLGTSLFLLASAAVGWRRSLIARRERDRASQQVELR